MTCYVLLAGGLGNQIFQFAAARKTNSEKIVFLDLLNNDRKSLNGYPEIFNLELGSRLELVKPTRFHLILRRYFLWLIGSTSKPDSFRFLLANSKLIKVISSLIVWMTTGIRTKVLLENRKLPQKTFVNTNHPYFLIGYFQNYEVSSHMVTKMDSLVPNQLSAHLIAYATSLESEKAIGMHVRRGDYVGHPTFGLLSKDYFKNVLLSIGDIDRPIIIFSDSKVVVSDFFPEHLIHLGKVCPDKFSASEVLYLMSRCSDLILSNSSLSWWAGFIAQVRGSTVVAPSPWFNKEIQSADFLVPKWKISKSIFLPKGTG
jgi:hypothetical protein